MKFKLYFAIFLFLSSCTPSVLKMTTLCPASNHKNIVTLKEFMVVDLKYDSLEIDKEAELYAFTGGDSTYFLFRLYEMEDIFWIDANFYNTKHSDIYFDADKFVLSDGRQQFLRRITPDITANLFLSRIGDMPKYTPKYEYTIESQTRGNVDRYGNYSEKTTYTVNQREDALNQLGHNIGSIIRSKINSDYRNMADEIYRDGYTDRIVIPARLYTSGSLFYLKPRNFSYPIMLGNIVFEKPLRDR